MTTCHVAAPPCACHVQMWWELDAGPALLLHFGMVGRRLWQAGCRHECCRMPCCCNAMSYCRQPCFLSCNVLRACHDSSLPHPSSAPFSCGPPSKMQTGGLVAKGIGAAHYKSFVIDDTNWPPRFCKIELKLEDGTQVGAREGRPTQQPWAACSAELGCCTYALRECMCMSSALIHAEERHGWTCLASWGCMSAQCSVPIIPNDAWWLVCMPPIPLHGPPLFMPLLPAPAAIAGAIVHAIAAPKTAPAHLLPPAAGLLRLAPLCKGGRRMLLAAAAWAVSRQRNRYMAWRMLWPFGLHMKGAVATMCVNC